MSAATLAKIGTRPWSVGSTVVLPDGRDAVVWSAAPAAHVWAAPDGDTRAMVLVKMPTATRAAYIVDGAAEREAQSLAWRERARTTGVVVSWERVSPPRNDWRGMPTYAEHREAGVSIHLPECPRSRVGFTETTTGGPSHGAVFTVTGELRRGTREAPLTCGDPAACCARAVRS